MSLTSNTEMMKQLNITSREVELVNFTKHRKLPPELRHHLLTFQDKKTLRAYSQRSKKCNEEVQQFNTIPPIEICIKDNRNCVDILLNYALIRHGAIRGTSQAEKKVIVSDDSGGQEIEEQLLKYYKYVKTGTTDKMKVRLKKWPIRIMNLPFIAAIKEWKVGICPATLDGFLESFQNREDNIEHFTVDHYNRSNIAEELTILPSFFKSPFLKKAKHVQLLVPCSVENKDWVNLQIPYFKLRGFASNQGIRQKIALINSHPTIEIDSIIVWLPNNESRKYDMDELFPKDQYLGGRSKFRTFIGIVRVFVSENGDKVMLFK